MHWLAYTNVTRLYIVWWAYPGYYQQSSFTKGLSTIDAILAMQLLSDIYNNFDHLPYIACNDLK